MTVFDEYLAERLAKLRHQGLYRELRTLASAQGSSIVIDGKEFINFGSNDYLGLANHPAVRTAAREAIARYGVGAGSSRLISGSMQPHHDLEEQLAAFKGTEAALTFSSGYATALGTICALCGKDDIIILDKLVHASIIDAARLSGAKLRVFSHNDLNELEDILKWADAQSASRSRALIVTESVFSMDGDCAPLKGIAELKQKHDAWLMVDEAHAVGVFGHAGRGLSDELGVANQIEIHMGTLGKAVGSAGGYICGSRTLIDFLINRARSFIFSTAPLPASAAAASAGLELCQSATGDSLRQQLRKNLVQLSKELQKQPSKFQTQIVPHILGTEEKATAAATRLRQEGLFVPAVRYPTVARGQARLRISLTAVHTSAHIQQLGLALASLPA